MINYRHLIISLYLILIVPLAYSQNLKDSTSISKFSVFREPSYILFGSGIGNLEPMLFEGNIVPYFMISLNQDNKWGIELSPRIIIRMYNKESFPIRTPSFIPKATFFYHLVDNTNKSKDLFMYFSWLHHSNGQDGSFYNVDSTTINTQSGNFSTNWIEGGVYISRPDPDIPNSSIDIKLYSAYDYLQESNLNGTYGRLRFYLDLQKDVSLTKIFKKHKRSSNNRSLTLKQSFRFGWICGNLTDTKTIDSKRLIFQYTLAFKPTFLNDIAVFARYNYGQDYYNIYYNRTINVFRIGIASSVNIFN
jgi:hypothetical protein